MSKLKDRISSFFIFNSNLGPKEGEELQRILFFHPVNVDEDSRKNQVGLCEAIVKFMFNFTSESCEEINTENKRTLMYQPEDNFYMVMVVKNEKPTASTAFELRGEQIPLKLIKNLLRLSYKMFRLFMGPFSELTREEIYQKCDTFFSPFLSEMHFTDSIADVIQGIDYLPLDKQTFFKILKLIDVMDIEYPQLRCITLLYNDRLVWNSLPTNDLQTVYKYLVCRLLPKHVEKELQGGAVTSAQVHGRYINPAGGIRTDEDLKCVHKIHLCVENNENALKKHYFIVYRAFSLTVCFTLNLEVKLDVQTFRSLDTFLGLHLSSLWPQLSAREAVSTTLPATNEPKYVYLNRLNLAFKTNIIPNKLIPATLLKPEVLNVIANMHDDRENMGSHGEVIIKTTDDYWIAGKASNEREFYVVIQQKNANLKEISDEVRRICDIQMKGIFFYPK